MSRVIPLYRTPGTLSDWIGMWLCRLGLLGIVVMGLLSGYDLIPDDTGWWAVPIGAVVVGYCMVWKTGYGPRDRGW